MFDRLFCFLSLVFLCWLQATFADDDLSESEIIAKVFKFYMSDDVTFLQSSESILPSFIFLARTNLELAENMSAIDRDLQRDFRVFNIRLSQVSEKFRHYAKAVDSEGTLFKLTGAFEVMENIEKQRQVLLSSGDPTNLDLIEQFDDAYDEGMVIVTDALFAAIYDKYGRGDQLLKVAVRILHRHPRLSILFMRGCVELLLHAFVLEATHLKVTEQPESTVKAFERRSKERLSLVIKSSLALYKSIGENIGHQIEADQRRFHETYIGLGHCMFVKALNDYLRDKYPHLSCFILSYDPVSSFDYHSVLFFIRFGSTLFREGKRNSLVDCRETKNLHTNFRNIGWEVLNSVNQNRKASSNYAKSVSDAVDNTLEKRNIKGVTISVVRTDAKSCYNSIYGQTVKAIKKTYKCNTKLCWIKKSYEFLVVLFG